MRTNIVIDDGRMAKARQTTGLRPKREAVDLGLKTLLRLRDQQDIRALRGKFVWTGDLDAPRADD